jgi:hypothetical protein
VYFELGLSNATYYWSPRPLLLCSAQEASFIHNPPTDKDALSSLNAVPVPLHYLQDGVECVQRGRTVCWHKHDCASYSPAAQRSTWCVCSAGRVTRATTVSDAAAQLVAALQLIVKQPLAECGPTNRNVFFVLRNRSEMHENFNGALVRSMLPMFIHCLTPWVQLAAPCTCTHTL